MREWVQPFCQYAYVADKPPTKKAKIIKSTTPPSAARRGLKKAPHVVVLAALSVLKCSWYKGARPIPTLPDVSIVIFVESLVPIRTFVLLSVPQKPPPADE
jgi:hypothetical protein